MKTLIMGTVYQKQGNNIIRSIDTYLERKEILENNEIKVKFLADENNLFDDVINMGAELKKAGERDIISVPYPEKIKQDKTTHYVKTIKWPCDAFQIFDNTAYVYKVHKKTSPHILKKINPSLKIKSAILGEGGLFIRYKDIIFGAGYKHKDWKKLKKHNLKYCPIYIPNPKSKDDRERELANYLGSFAHVDLNINFVENEENPIVCVRDIYYHIFKRGLDNLIDLMGAKMHLVVGEELNHCPTNFIKLPNKKIALPDKAHSTIDFLVENLGQDKIIPLPTIPNECSNNFGLRCATNLI